MGYLTPVLFYNDSTADIENDYSFNENLSSTLSGAYSRHRDDKISVRGYKQYWFDKVLNFFGLARIRRTDWNSSSNVATILKPEHMDTQRVIVVYGNTWLDLTDQGEKEFTDKNEYVITCLGIADRYVKLYKRFLKENRLKEKEANKPKEDIFLLKYHCPYCEEYWEDTSSSMNNDRCPKCNKEIEPEEVVDLNEE